MGSILIGAGIILIGIALLLGKPITINTNATYLNHNEERKPENKITLLPQDDDPTGHDSPQPDAPIKTEDLAKTIQDFIFGEDA